MPDQSGFGSNGNEGVLCIPQSSSITGTSPSDCLVSYPGHSLGGLTPLQRCSRYILQPQPTGPRVSVLSLFLLLSWVTFYYQICYSGLTFYAKYVSRYGISGRNDIFQIIQMFSLCLC